jgi:hypothetical protein
MYASEDQIVNSINKLPINGGQINTFIGLFMLIKYGRLINNNYFSVEMNKVQHHLDMVLHFNRNKPNRTAGKLSYVLYSKYWIDFVKTDLLCGKKISASDFSILMYWGESFEDHKALLDKLKYDINNDVFYDVIFDTKDSVDLNASSVADPSLILSKLGGRSEFTYSVQDRKFISKTAGDLSAAPFAQTLYANKSLRECIFIADFDFLEKFDLNKSELSPSFELPNTNSINLPKPFLLLAGISGTGKSNFVKNQALRSGDLSNFLMLPVRPDWHEPSDLLGYVSRIGATTKYIPTSFLIFIVKAWLSVFEGFSDKGVSLKPLEDVPTFWVCLDEMNLAPIEQYFSDYLSVIETRKWTDEGTYSCEPLIKVSDLLQGESDNVFNSLRKDLNLMNSEILWSFFLKFGISIPPNLVVAGTVNMDETAHGFSRKVIDRALTIDFDIFFANEFDKFFEGQNIPITLKFPRFSHPTLSKLKVLAPADPDGKKTIEFLNQVNKILNGTSFSIAYRALSECLLSLQSFRPTTQVELDAIWDDFLMWKVLPRIGGDEDKLRNSDGVNVIEALLHFLKNKFNEPGGDHGRVDLLAVHHDGSKISIPYRTPPKLEWMRSRLSAGFTSFWP